MTHFSDRELREWSHSGPGPERERVIAHLATCADCAAAYAHAIRSESISPERASLDGLRDVGEFVQAGCAIANQRATVATVATFPASRRRALLVLAAAAALVLAIAVPFMLRQHDQQADISYRGAGLQALAPSGTVADNGTFEWSTDLSPVAFRVDIGDATGVVDSETTTATRLRLPPEVSKKLTIGIDYWWTVTALDRSGQPIAVSARRTFRLRPR